MEYKIGTQVFNDWQIIREIGEGSFGKVFEIQKTDYGVTTRSALKVVRVPKSQSDIRAALADGMDEKSVTTYFRGFVEEIVKEIAIMSSLKSHPGIVSCEDHKVIEHAGQIGWDILIRMELLQSLNDYQLSHTMDEATVRQMALDLTGALAFCQKKALIHRDIKPENIFVSETSQFKLGDFGVARTAEKTTGGLSKKGTESYMAPEVYLARPYGSTVDIYSLGLVLYKFMNYGRLPFLPAYPAPITFADRENAMAKRMQGVPLPPPAAASPAFADIILKACAYDPEDRYRTAAEMLAALQGQEVSVPTPQPPAEPTPAPKPIPPVDTEKDKTVGMWGTQPDADDHGTVGMWNAVPAPGPAPVAPNPPVSKPNPSNKKPLILGISIAAAVVILIAVILLVFAFGDDASDIAEQNASTFAELGDLAEDSVAEESSADLDSYAPYDLDSAQSQLWQTACENILFEASVYQDMSANDLIVELSANGYYFLQSDRSTFDMMPYRFSDGESFGITTVYDSYQYAIAVPESFITAYGPNIPAELLHACITICADANDNLLAAQWTWNPIGLDIVGDDTYIHLLPLTSAGSNFTIHEFAAAYGINEEMLAVFQNKEMAVTDTGFLINHHDTSYGFSNISIEMPIGAYPFASIGVIATEDEYSISLYYTSDARDMSLPDVTDLNLDTTVEQPAETTTDYYTEEGNQAYWEPIIQNKISDLDTELSNLLINYTDTGTFGPALEYLRDTLRSKGFTTTNISSNNSFHATYGNAGIYIQNNTPGAGLSLDREIVFYYDPTNGLDSVDLATLQALSFTPAHISGYPRVGDSLPTALDALGISQEAFDLIPLQNSQDDAPIFSDRWTSAATFSRYYTIPPTPDFGSGATPENQKAFHLIYSPDGTSYNQMTILYGTFPDFEDPIIYRISYKIVQ